VLRRSVESTQYTSAEFHRFCKENLIQTSVGRTGVCWDNAAAESFFAALKNEMYYRQHWPTRARARFAVAEYIEVLSRYADGCTPPSATAPRSKHSPTTAKQRPLLDQQPEEPSKIVDTAQRRQYAD
jgi:transposase InsO family protein